MLPAPVPPSARPLRAATLGLLGSAASTALGVVLGGTVGGRAASVLTLVGWAGFAYSLHAFGRAGRS